MSCFLRLSVIAINYQIIKYENLKNQLENTIEAIYNDCSFLIFDVVVNAESKEYNACEFMLNGMKVISRNAKTTPKKNGQFVTFWKRNNNGITEPFDSNEGIDFFVVNVSKENRIGQFVIPQSVLVEKKIMSTDKVEGKRGFRVYPDWDDPSSKQAEKTQQWQSKYFVEFDSDIDLDVIKKLYDPQ